MSARTALLLAGLAALSLPLAVPASRAPAPVQLGAVQPGADTARVRALLGGVRGTPPLACELALQPLGNGWWGGGSQAPDAAADVVQVVRTTGQRVQDPLAVPVLTAALGDGDACVRRVALRLLGRSRLPEARTALTQALRSDDPARRVQGAMGLGYVGNHADLPLLIAALEDRDPSVREAAAWAIGTMH